MPTGVALRVYYVCCFAALGVYLPTFPRWLEARGIDGWAMGIVAAAFPAMSVVAPPIFGVAADSFGLRASLLRVASAGAMLAFGVLAAAARVASPSFVIVVSTVAVFAFFRAPMVMMADVLAMERAAAGRAEYGSVRLWGSIGFLASALAGGRWIHPAKPFDAPLAITIALAGAFATSLFLPSRASGPRAPVPEHVRELLRAPDVRLFLVASFFGQAAHSAYDLTFSLHLRDLGVSSETIGVAWAIGVLAEIGLMAFSARWSARGDRAAARATRLLTLAFLGATLRWLIVAHVRDPALLLLAQPLHAASFGAMWLSSLAFLRERAPPHVLASAQGMFVSVVGAASVCGMLVWGGVYAAGGGRATFGVAAALSAAASVVAFFLSRGARSEVAVSART